jgi:pyridinium-3,5-biscarboxylic acid mononucleotide synthase
MNPSILLTLLQDVQSGASSIDQALAKLRNFPAESVPDACLDQQRLIRTGIPEVIYGASKTVKQIVTIAKAMLQQGGPVLATRIDSTKAKQVRAILPQFQYANEAKMLICNPSVVDKTRYRGQTLVISAGTSDLPVAEEARLTLEALGHPVDKLYDAGVAGIHRLLVKQHVLQQASVIIVVAGMEGALPSVVGGLVSCPVIAVPTSVGYGASFGGIAALLGMLNSCAPGVAVVNIDNGFGAACMAEAINRDFKI